MDNADTRLGRCSESIRTVFRRPGASMKITIYTKNLTPSAPMISVGKMVRHYFWGILNAIRLKVNNCMLEAKNNRIQRIKNIACGFRNRNRFKNAILFHLGGLDLMPVAT